MPYVSSLTAAQIQEAVGHSHAFWGGTHDLEEYNTRTFLQLERGAGLVRFSGLTNESGVLLSSLKRYAMKLSAPTESGPRLIRSIGLGAVYTSSPARHQGAASSLILSVLAECQS